MTATVISENKGCNKEAFSSAGRNEHPQNGLDFLVSKYNKQGAHAACTPSIYATLELAPGVGGR
jgi:hypothetical protein